MNKLFGMPLLRTIAAAMIATAAPLAIAGGGDVSWSISVGSPYPAPQVYVPPPVVYVEPAPVYVRPQPVYVQPAPVVRYGQPYYVEEVHYRRMHRRHWKHHHRGGYDD